MTDRFRFKVGGISFVLVPQVLFGATTQLISATVVNDDK